VRASLPQLHASVRSETLSGHDGGILATVRRAPIGPLVGLYNVTRETRTFPADRVRELGLEQPWDAMSARPVEADEQGRFWLTPYAAWWLVDQPD